MNRDTTARPFRQALLLFAGFAFASLLLMWSWNTLGHDLFGGPRAGFRHGVAAAVLCGIAMAAFRSGRRFIASAASARDQIR